MKLIPKNWSEFQQYKDRKPSWIKLHRDLLNDFSYSSVQIGTKATLPLLWLLACEYDDGIIDASVEEIAFRIHIDEKTVDKALKELIDRKFFTIVQDCTEPYKMVPREEKRRDREETELEKKKVDNKQHNFSFSLDRDTEILNTSEEYRLKLKEKIDEFIINLENRALRENIEIPKCTMDFEDFMMKLQIKTYKYKNFWLVYQEWHRSGVKREMERKNAK